MSWKDKDWDFLRFYNNDRDTLEEAVKHYFKFNKSKSAYLNSTIFPHIEYDSIHKEITIYRCGKDIEPPNEYDEKKLQYLADCYDVCVKYTWLSSYRIFDIKPTIEE